MTRNREVLDKVRGELRACVDKRLERDEPDAAVGRVLLATRYNDPAACRWSNWPRHAPREPLHSRDVALLGCRLFLGHDREWLGRFSEAADKELRREPHLAPPSIGNDDRLLLGIAAGIGAVRSVALAERLEALVHGRGMRIASRHVIDELACSFARGSGRLPAHLLNTLEAMRRVGDRLPITDGDRIAVFWAATRLQPETRDGTAERQFVDDAICDGLRFLDEANGVSELRALDQFMLYDAVVSLDAQSAPRRRDQDAPARAHLADGSLSQGESTAMDIRTLTIQHVPGSETAA